jgi:hypothetical protein
MSDRGKAAVQADDQVVGAAELRSLKKRVRELERLLGRKTMEVEILKEALEIAREKNCSRAHRCPGRTVSDETRGRDSERFPLQTCRAGGGAAP